MTSPPDILLRVLPQSLDETRGPLESRPYVTLTYAQSLDAKIAGVGGKQLILSGAESMLMTHWFAITSLLSSPQPQSTLLISSHRMRTMHDAILVGIGTALNDNPQLNSGSSPR